MVYVTSINLLESLTAFCRTCQTSRPFFPP